MILAARSEGLPLTVETCHHYLNLVSEKIPDRATQYKCCPPIREASNQVEKTFYDLKKIVLLSINPNYIFPLKAIKGTGNYA